MHWEYCKNCPHKKVHVWEVIHVHKTFHAREKVHVSCIQDIVVSVSIFEVEKLSPQLLIRELHILSLFGHVCIEFISPMYEIACEI
jgi:hypothetical protein